jgi:hypothetical protein
MAFLAADSAVTCAAKGVPFLEPLNPSLPALDHAITFPAGRGLYVGDAPGYGFFSLLPFSH